MAALTDYSVAMLSSTTVTFASAAATTLYTVPSGKTLIIDKVSIVGSADATSTTITIGRVGTLTDYVNTQTLSGLNGAGKVVTIRPIQSATPPTETTYAAGVVVQVNVTATGGGTTHTFKLFGTLY